MAGERGVRRGFRHETHENENRHSEDEGHNEGVEPAGDPLEVREHGDVEDFARDHGNPDACAARALPVHSDDDRGRPDAETAEGEENDGEDGAGLEDADRNRDHAEHRRHDAGDLERVFIRRVALQNPLVEVAGDGRRGGEQQRADRGHARREDTGDHECGDDGGKARLQDERYYEVAVLADDAGEARGTRDAAPLNEGSGEPHAERAEDHGLEHRRVVLHREELREEVRLTDAEE